MKLLAFTDLHARAVNPRARTDDYNAAWQRKLGEVAQLARLHQVTAVLFGGDLTDTPDVAASTTADLITALRQFPCPIYGVSGNTHDVWGDQPSTVHRTALGIVQAAGLITLLEPGSPVILEAAEGFRVQISGQPYHVDMDRRDWRRDYCVFQEGFGPEGHQHFIRFEDGVSHIVHIVHGMLRATPLPYDAPHTMVQDVLWETCANITLSGHDHGGFGVLRHPSAREQFACNPGALMRLSAAASDINRMPRVALITLTTDACDVELIQLKTALPGDQVLDRTHLDEATEQEAARNRLMAGLAAEGEFTAINPLEITQQVADRKAIRPEVRAEALDRIRAAQESGAGEEVA